MNLCIPPQIQVFLLSLVSTAALAEGMGDNLSSNGTNDTSICSQYGALFTNIDRNLARWKARGISLDLMQQTAERNTARKGQVHLSPYQRCFLAGFRGGRAYLLEEIDLERIGHHAVGVHTKAFAPCDECGFIPPSWQF